MDLTSLLADLEQFWIPIKNNLVSLVQPWRLYQFAMLVAGFLIARAGRLLDQGDTIEHNGTRFTVERVARRRITRVRMEHLSGDLSVDGAAPTNGRN